MKNMKTQEQIDSHIESYLKKIKLLTKDDIINKYLNKNYRPEYDREVYTISINLDFTLCDKHE